MAKDPNIQEATEQFETGQLEHLDSIVTGADILEKIENLHGDVRQQIEDAIPGHARLFDEALRREVALTSNPSRARASAVKAIYGKFILNSRPAVLADVNGDFLKKMNEVLGETADRNDPAISAAMHRVAVWSAGANGVDAAQVKSLLDDVFKTADNVAIQQKKREIRKSEESKKSLEDAQKYFEGKDVDNLKGDVEKFQTFYASDSSSLDENTSLFNQKTALEDLIKFYEGERSKKGASKQSNSGMRQPRSGVSGSSVTPEEATSRIVMCRTRIATIGTFIDMTSSVSAKALEFLASADTAFEIGVSDPNFKVLQQRFRTCNANSPSFSLTSFKNDLDLLSRIVLRVNTTGVVDALDAKIADAEQSLKTAEKELNGLESAKDGNKNLSPAAFSRRLVDELVKKQNPGLSDEARAKTVTAILMEDIATIQNSRSVADLAHSLGAEVSALGGDLAMDDNIINFGYKQGDNVTRPFSKFKPENFASWDAIEALFDRDAIGLNEGFILLEALNYLNDGHPSDQSVKLEEHLRGLIAKELGITDKLPDSKLSEVANEAFDTQRSRTIKMHEGFRANLRARTVNVTEKRIEILSRKIQLLNDQRRLKKITAEKYETDYQELLDQAECYGLRERLDFEQDATLARYSNSPLAQWFRDKGFGFSKWGEAKGAAATDQALGMGAGLALGSMEASLRTGWFIISGIARIGWSIPRGLIWNKSAGFGATTAKVFTEGVSGTVGFAKTKGAAAANRLKAGAKAVGDTKSDAKSGYADRTTINPEDEDKALNELQESILPEPVDIGDKAFINLDEYKSRITKIINETPSKEAK